MSTDDTGAQKRRVIVPQKQETVQASAITLLPDAPTLIQDALSVIATEIVKFKVKVSKGQSLDINEGRLLNNYIKSLCDLSRETREREADMDLANMDDESLLSLVQKLQAKVKTDNNGSNNGTN